MKTLSPLHLGTWAMFFATVKSFQYHPGHNREGSAKPLTTAECARVADDMMDEYKQREEIQWPG